MANFLHESSTSPPPLKINTINIIKRPFINNQIRASKVRVVDETGKQLGVLGLTEALEMAKEKNLDLIQLTEKVDPPVCKIMKYGKYLYSLEKKEKQSRTKTGGEIKGVRLTFNISLHDLETRARQAEKFLKKGNKVKAELILKGREKVHENFGKEKINKFLEILEKLIPIKIERELKKEPKGFTIIIAKG